jgi:D-alanine-D-alanine ligase
MRVTFQVVVLHRPLTFSDPSLIETVMTEQTIEYFDAALKTAGLDPLVLPVGDDIARDLDQFDHTRTVYFNCCEGIDDDPNGYDPITALLEELGCVFTGAADPVLVRSFHKGDMKTRLVGNNIPTPEYALCTDGDSRGWDIFPALVKPVNQHGSFGISRASVVDTPEQLEARVRHVYDCWKQPALVEDFIDGPEYRVFILGNGHLEILPLYATYYDAAPDYHDHLWGYDNKWTEHGTNDILRYALPPTLDADVQARIETAALDGYRVCEARDYGAVDIRVRDGIPYVLDVNQNPDITDGGSFAQAAAACGCSYPELLAKIVLLASQRLPGR